ncbi:MAG TPA: YaiO family outer membrane beta-barrel protein [Sphingobacteriaceae bacterium]|nr:YaiO family outer membrane beta-barrel protein [Sphingobacteriaceae bacterium]
MFFAFLSLIINRTQVIKENNLYNNIGAGYSFVYFDKRFSDPWHLSYVTYGTKTRYGSVNFTLNYSNRFKSNATEFELESYPRIINGLYAYLGGGTQLSGSLYPKYRIGLSLYKSLPNGFEIEGGIRHLQFGTTTNVFVAGLLKYVGNNYLNLKSYLTPSVGKLSKSFNLTLRSFLSDDRNDYIGGSIGTGLSPDERAIGIFEPNLLQSLRGSLDYSRNVTRQTTLAISLNYANEEYRADTFGNQYTINGSISRRF